ncbi:MAG: hypothetical protein L0J71_02515, partial [Bifidobacterium crudilactis]|nr:hypothetical protein [Bifidobacterium crudilactis]
MKSAAIGCSVSPPRSAAGKDRGDGPQVVWTPTTGDRATREHSPGLQQAHEIHEVLHATPQPVELPHVRDLTPIRGLNRLMMLRLNGTAVTDYSQLNMPKRIFNLDVYINPGQPAPTIGQQRAWRINIITQ